MRPREAFGYSDSELRAELLSLEQRRGVLADGAGFTLTFSGIAVVAGSGLAILGAVWPGAVMLAINGYILLDFFAGLSDLKWRIGECERLLQERHLQSVELYEGWKVVAMTPAQPSLEVWDAAKDEEVA
jgi:hypothetical protein